MNRPNPLPQAALARLGTAVGLGVAYSLFAYLLTPSVVNGDGVGYLKATLGGARYPGHLLLLPLFEVVKQLVHAATPATLLPSLRLICLVAGGLAVAIVVAILWPRGRRVALVGAGGLAASYSVLISTSDLESYAPALVPVCLFLWALDRQRPFLAALCAALASLLHVENVLLALPLLALAGPWRRRLASLALFGGIVGAAYLVALQQGGLGWLRQMHHGFAYPLSWRIAPATLHGLGKALVYAPYPYEAPLPVVIAQSLLGVAALGALLARRFAVPRDEQRWLVAWLVPYALLGATYFPSDHERWIFLLPLLWVVVARSERRRDPGIVAAIALANLILWLPVAKDRRALDRAEQTATRLQAGDLVIGPGHGWDEQLAMVAPSVEVLPLVYYAGIADLPRTIAERRAKARRTILVRLDGSDDDPRGWKELLPFGLDRVTIGKLLPGRRTRLAPGVELLEDEGERK